MPISIGGIIVTEFDDAINATTRLAVIRMLHGAATPFVFIQAGGLA
jgi:hypothetical protein